MFDEYGIFDFEKWYNLHKHNIPAHLKQEANTISDKLIFVFTWKKYEAATAPRLRKLMYRQFPLLKNAPAQYHEQMEKNVIHRIFETFQFMWAIALWNNQGKHPLEECPQLYKFELEHKEYPWEKKYHDVANPPDWIKSYPKEEWKKVCDKENKILKKAGAYIQSVYNGAIDILQEEIMKLLPQLINMEKDWWLVYKRIMLREAGRWKDTLESIEFKITHPPSKKTLKTQT